MRNLLQIATVHSFTLSFKFTCKCFVRLQNATAILLQNATEVYYKMHQVFYRKMRQLLQNATFITKCDFYYKLRLLLHIATVRLFSYLFKFTYKCCVRLIFHNSYYERH